MRNRHLLIVLMLATPAVHAASAAAAGAAPTVGNVDISAAGAKVFADNCSVCHRSDGSGGVSFGATKSADLRSPHLETLYRNKDDLILRAILYAKDQNGKPLDMPMPAWNGRLTTKQAREVIAFLRTLHE